jgi:putative DNA primase/helicase
MDRRRREALIMDDPVTRVVEVLARDGYDPRKIGPDRYESRCPLHRGRRRNLSICQGDDGRVLIHCHHVDDNGHSCSVEEIVQAIGLTIADLCPTAGHHNETNGKAHVLNGVAKKKTAGKALQRGKPTAEALIRKLSAELGRVTGSWTYHLANGEEAFRVLRFDPADGKTFRPIHQSPTGWVVGDLPGLLLL